MKIGYLFLFLFCNIFFGIATIFAYIFNVQRSSKKNKQTLKKLYPWFSLPWYKKIFLIGLKGKVPTKDKIILYISNIVLLLQIIICICAMIFESEIFDKIGGILCMIILDTHILVRSFFRPQKYDL